MDRPELRESIDACRPASDDLHLPELALLAEEIETDAEVREILERAQRLDRRIAEALHDLPVPAGLCDRIAARLEADQQARQANEQAARLTEVAPAERDISPVDRPRQFGRRFGRREWLVASMAGAAVVLACVGAWEFWPRAKPLSVDRLLASSGQWHGQLAGAGSWQALQRGRVIKEFPTSDSVRATPRGWADVSAWVGRPAVAYDLGVGPGRRATLFVINEPGTAADAIPPRTPSSNTGGLMIGVWQADGLVYVLVVEGDQRRYDQLLENSAQPVAMLDNVAQPLA